MDFLSANDSRSAAPWTLLLVDDEPEVHDVTRLVLSGFRFEERPVQILSAMSAAEARTILRTRDDVAVIFLDVVMESDQAGLELADYIRNDLKNHDVRIVLRTGQPGQAPEHEVIARYDINDYKEKTELTAQKLSTTLFAALRAWRDILTIRTSKHGLERVISASFEVFSHERTADFAATVLGQLAGLLGEGRGTLCVRLGPEDDDRRLVAAIATGPFEQYVGHDLEQTLPPHLARSLRCAVHDGQHRFARDHCVLAVFDPLHGERLLFLAQAAGLSDIDRKLVEVFATNVSIAFTNLQLTQELSDAQLEMIFLLAGAAESRSRETAAHVRRVGMIAELLGREVGLDDAFCERLRHAAPLHDIGKIGIPDAILNKPGQHTSEEAVIMRAHAEIGYRMLAPSRRSILQLAAEIAYTHHERWDGAGYPRGLAGEAIPVSGRITMLADVFDALGSRRCYKEAWSKERIRDFIEANSGKMFDPALTDLLMRNWDRAEAIRAQLPD
jgi:response regulator RpfG family c-di-GMP phosphodiesterase